MGSPARRRGAEGGMRSYGKLVTHHRCRHERVFHDAFFLDKGNITGGERRKKLIVLPSYRASVISFVDKKVLKKDMNNDFYVQHPELEIREIKLTHLRAIRADLLAFALEEGSPIEVVTAAHANWYFERLIMRGMVGKRNRRLILAICVLLAIKFIETGDIQKKINYAKTHFRQDEAFSGVTWPKVQELEFRVYVGLDFTLMPEKGNDVVETHIERLLGQINVTSHEYYSKNFCIEALHIVMDSPPVGAVLERTALLNACWQRCMSQLFPHTDVSSSASSVSSPFAQLMEKYITTRYSEPQRHYHTLVHLDEMLQHLQSFQSTAPPAQRLETIGPQHLTVDLALLFHDAVYDPTRGDNEERSVDWFRTFWTECTEMAKTAPLCGNAELAQRVETDVVAYILQTKQHMSVEPLFHAKTNSIDASIGTVPPLHVFLDLDLAILGCDETRYMAYTEEVRNEYGFYSAKEFCQGRIKFLRGFLDYPQWYKTEFFHRKLEAKARENVMREVTALEAQMA